MKKNNLTTTVDLTPVQQEIERGKAIAAARSALDMAKHNLLQGDANGAADLAVWALDYVKKLQGKDVEEVRNIARKFLAKGTPVSLTVAQPASHVKTDANGKVVNPNREKSERKAAAKTAPVQSVTKPDPIAPWRKTTIIRRCKQAIKLLEGLNDIKSNQLRKEAQTLLNIYED